MVFCRHCGIQMEDDQLYCIRCGTPSRPVDAPARPINEDKAPEQEPQAMPQTPPPQYQAPERPVYHQAPPPQYQPPQRPMYHQAPPPPMQNRPPYAYDPRMPMMEEERVRLKGGWLALSIINILLSVIFLFFDGATTLVAVALLAMSIIGLVFTAIAANKPKRVARPRLTVSKIMNIISIVINGFFVLVIAIAVVAVLFMMILEACGVVDPSFIYEAESMLFKF